MTHKPGIGLYRKLFHWLHYLAIPFDIASIYFLTISFFTPDKAARVSLVGNGLLLLGFGLGLQSLQSPAETTAKKPEQKTFTGITLLILAGALLLLAMVIFIVKERGIYDSLGLGFCSCAVGFFALAKEQFNL